METQGSDFERWKLIGPILDDILAWLIYIHQQNFIHRDLKPSNGMYSS